MARFGSHSILFNLAADLVNLALPGHAGGRDYRAPDAEAAAARFLALLRPATRQTPETVDGGAGRKPHRRAPPDLRHSVMNGVQPRGP